MVEHHSFHNDHGDDAFFSLTTIYVFQDHPLLVLLLIGLRLLVLVHWEHLQLLGIAVLKFALIVVAAAAAVVDCYQLFLHVSNGLLVQAMHFDYDFVVLQLVPFVLCAVVLDLSIDLVQRHLVKHFVVCDAFYLINSMVEVHFTLTLYLIKEPHFLILGYYDIHNVEMELEEDMDHVDDDEMMKLM